MCTPQVSRCLFPISMTKRQKSGKKVVNLAGKEENPFDKFANNRKKFDVLNRRVKGEDRNVGRARAKVIHSSN